MNNLTGETLWFRHGVLTYWISKTNLRSASGGTVTSPDWCSVHSTLKSNHEKQDGEICSVTNNSAADCRISLKFGKLVHCMSAELAELLKLLAGELWDS